MGIFLLRLDCHNLNNFKEGSLTLDFITEKRVSANEADEGAVSNLFGRVYKLDTIAFAGINATGKTTVLSLLSSLLKVYIGNGSLDYEMRFKAFFESTLKVEAYFYREETKEVYRLVSEIKKDEAAQSLYFLHERLYCKPVLSSTNKENMFSFSENDLFIDRDSADTLFLKREDSVFSIVMNSYTDAGIGVQDLCAITNHNWISTVAFGLLVPFAQYLDSSIEYIRVKDVATGQSSRVVFEIKFVNYSAPVMVEPRDLELYLSSGTIKGISCLSAITVVLERGGYILIDEIENHLNKTIVIGLIELFAGKMNKKKATLLFSTHYSEILDCVGRSDGIYLLDKSSKIELKKFSNAAGAKDRKDKKKSDLILSGTLAKAPSYQAYLRMIKNLSAYLKEAAAE